MTTVELLRGARNILRAKKRWAKKYYAYDAKQQTVDYSDPKAVSFCTYGAILKAGDFERGNTYHNEALSAYAFLKRATGENNLAAFNDAPKRKHSEVIAAFNAAIKLAVAKEKEDARNARMARTRALRA